MAVSISQDWNFYVFDLKRFMFSMPRDDLQALAEFAENNYNVDQYPRILSAYPIWLEWATRYKIIAREFPAYQTTDVHVYKYYNYAVLNFLAEKHTYDMVVKTAQSIMKWKKELQEQYKPEAYLPELIEEMKSMNLI